MSFFALSEPYDKMDPLLDTPAVIKIISLPAIMTIVVGMPTVFHEDFKCLKTEIGKEKACW